MEDFNIYSQFYPEEKLNFQIHRVVVVVLKIWCYYMATVFALEHPGGF